MGRFTKRVYFCRESVLQIHLYIEDGGVNMEHYIIYKYIKIDENEVVYVGRTNNLERRRREHEVYEPTEVKMINILIRYVNNLYRLSALSRSKMTIDTSFEMVD